MPELYAVSNIKRHRFFDSYIDTYLTIDVSEILNIKDKELFKKFMIAVAYKNSEQLNYNNISREIGITDKTCKEWFNILVSSGIIYLLEPFRTTKLDRITHIPKIIWMDSGLCAYLAGWETARDLQLSSTAGHYLESYIVSDLIKSYDAIGEPLNITYYRDKEKDEIDLIIEKNNIIYPFEVKKTSSPNRAMLKNFSKLDNINKKVGKGGVICFYEELIPLDENNMTIPISSIINASEK